MVISHRGLLRGGGFVVCNISQSRTHPETGAKSAFAVRACRRVPIPPPCRRRDAGSAAGGVRLPHMPE